MNYYNEIELSARRWLRELIKDGLIPDGYIDNRPIQEVKAHELREFVQCHFFAGIGGWPYALRLAGVPDDEPLWTGSCPCQPFSDSGDQMGFRDPRHLFPTWRRLIARGRPAIVLGEQVASALGREWLARVRLEMATLGYATRAADLCSAGVAAPNRRQRLFWFADALGNANEVGRKNAVFKSSDGACASRIETSNRVGNGNASGSVAIANGSGWLEHAEQHGEEKQDSANGDSRRQHAGGCGELPRMAHPDGRRCKDGDAQRLGDFGQQPGNGGSGVALGDTNDAGREGRGLRLVGDAGQLPPWASGTIGLQCTDGKTRRVKPEIFPLAPRLPGDLGLIRGAGNAINPWIAVEFIRACFIQ